MVLEVFDRVGFNEQSGRWHWLAGSGRTGFVAESAVRAEMLVHIEAASVTLDHMTEALYRGQIDLAQWELGSASLLKDLHVSNAIFGRGGRSLMGPSDFGRIGGTLRAEYRRLHQFAGAIASGEVSLAQAKARIKQYANGVQKSFWRASVIARKVAGQKEERRFLQPGESCPDCVGFAAQEWVKIGTLPPPGVDSQCLSNCNCIKEFRA